MYQVVDKSTDIILLETENLQEAQEKYDYANYYGDPVTIREVWKNALVIGRHQSDLPDFNIVETRNITWGATRQDVTPILGALLRECLEKKWVLLFQNTPGQLTSALTRGIETTGLGYRNVGVIVSKPSAMPSEPVTGKVQVYPTFGDGVEYWNLEAIAKEIEHAMKVINPRAKVEIDGQSSTGCEVNYSVEPPRPFEFSHIEWL